jgi:hypothetical protein
MQRRTLLKLSLGAGTALAVAGAGVAWWVPGVQGDGLSAPARQLFVAVAQAVLDGALPDEAVAREKAIVAHLKRLDQSIAGLAPATRDELSQLLALLTVAPGRLALAGLTHDWSQASLAEVQAALQAMRLSRSTTRQQVYHALRDLTNAAYYADAATWAQLGYPGPTAL